MFRRGLAALPAHEAAYRSYFTGLSIPYGDGELESHEEDVPQRVLWLEDPSIFYSFVYGFF